MFNLHLKECEFRFNNRKQNIYRILLAIFRKEPLKLSWPNNLIKELIGYIILWVILALLSASIVSFAEGNPAGIVILFKVLVDLFLFFLAFYVQKNIIFSIR